MAEHFPLKVGGLTFDRWVYDPEGDVLYLHIGKPRPAEGEETPEGHVVRYYAHGRVAGITIVNARWLLDRDGAITVTPPQLRLEAHELRSVLRPAG